MRKKVEGEILEKGTIVLYIDDFEKPKNRDIWICNSKKLLDATEEIFPLMEMFIDFGESSIFTIVEVLDLAERKTLRTITIQG